MSRTKWVGLLLCCLMLVLSPAGLAQNVQNNGTIQGTVSDAAGAAVGGAEVTVVSDDVGTTRTATSNAEGFYAFTELSPGHYHVVVKKDGFKT
jgi:protocatechuate 3,4-dioxygenase beta subunit